MPSDRSVEANIDTRGPTLKTFFFGFSKAFFPIEEDPGSSTGLLKFAEKLL